MSLLLLGSGGGRRLLGWEFEFCYRGLFYLCAISYYSFLPTAGISIVSVYQRKRFILYMFYLELKTIVIVTI